MFEKALFKISCNQNNMKQRTQNFNNFIIKILTSSFIALSMLVSGCSFVDSLPGSERVVLSHQTEECKKLGSTHVSVLSQVAGFDRDLEVMSDELITLARNAAFEKGGNTIQPVSEIVDGAQDFDIFRCR